MTPPSHQYISNSVRLYRYGLPVLLLTLGVVLSLWFYANAQQDDAQKQLERFASMGDELVQDVEAMIAGQQQLLSGVRGLFDASSEVSRAEFHQYLSSVSLAKRLPGALAVGWYRHVAKEDIASFEESIQNDTSLNSLGYPEFNVFPPTNNPSSLVITFVRHTQLDAEDAPLGFDLLSDPMRTKAVQKARDSGHFVVSKPFPMLNGEPGNRGFLMLLPVYTNSEAATLQKRRSSFLGTLSGVFRVSLLMGQSSQDTFQSVQLYDTAGASSESINTRLTAQPDNLFYSTGELDPEGTTIQRVLSLGGRQWLFEITLSHSQLNALSDSSPAWYGLVTGLLLSLISSSWIYSLLAARDRARKRALSLSADLIEANKELERSNNDLSQFAFVASHDLQTPVRNVDLSITLLEEALGNRMDVQVREYLVYLRNSSDRMQKLVQDLLTYARVNKVELEVSDIDMKVLCRDVLADMKEAIEEHNVDITVGSLPQIVGDKDQIERLLMNLISNAIRYRHAERDPLIDITASLQETHWIIAVKDNGIGIESRFHKRVFEPFQRLHSHNDIAGSGLGLGICRQIVDSHGGELCIKSSNSTGTTFEFSLPLAEAAKLAA